MIGKKILEIAIYIDKNASASVLPKIDRKIVCNGLLILKSSCNHHSPNRNLYAVQAETHRDFEAYTTANLLSLNESLCKIVGVKSVEVNMFSHQHTLKSERK